MFLSTLKPLKKDVSFDPVKDLDPLKNLVWKFFPGQKTRDYLFTLRNNGTTEILVQSPTKPFATNGNWAVESQPYNPTFEKGQKINFWVRVNAARRNANGKRVGVQSEYIQKLIDFHIPQDQWPTGEQILKRSIGGWFNEIGRYQGFELTAADISDPLVTMFRDHRGNGKPVYLHEVTGTLKVTDPKKFKALTEAGVGKMRGFGLGMLVLED